MRKLILCLFFITPSLFAFHLKERLEAAEAGTYIVTEQNQLASLLHLHSKEEGKLLFEEISIPLHLAKNIKWSTWVQEGAPKHTSWILYEVDLEKGCVTECYSKTRRSWVPTEEVGAFLIPLLSLELHYLSEKERLQTGPSPKPGEVNSRPWAPVKVIEGKKIQGAAYDAYRARWPIDHSEVSGKPIVLYFDQEDQGFPFPYWLQVRDGALKFKIRAIDSGKGLISPEVTIPRRLPQFVGGFHREGDSLLLTLQCPLYYEELRLYAIDMSASPRVTHLIPFEMERDKEMVSLKVDQQKLDTMLTANHRYTWILSAEDREVAVEMPHSYVH